MKTNYLIVGAGGVGGSIAGFLALAGNDVTCIARGEHLAQIRKNGLHLKSDMKGEHYIKLKAFSAEEYNDKADVIFVCVKGYSIDSIGEVLKKAAKPNTLVIPILNVYGTGPRIQKLVPEMTVLDGCIYIVGFVSAPGEITQMGQVFRLIFGARPNQNVDAERLNKISKSLENAEIHNIISDHINRDTFVKWSFISAMACTGAYHNCTMEPIQRPGKERDTFIGLISESKRIGEKIGIPMPADTVEKGLAVIDHLDPKSTASMQKDIARGHESEIKGQLFDIIDLGRKEGVKIPTYDMVEQKFLSFRPKK
ncbi:MAG: 2-dehydropantoate 2-reductase [Sphingobacteriia bacterium]|jgi:2-dehydropantoate 2-reductase|nr:2-dehydropantoate 2-reductase [Sphingobacteriia bacterium]